MVNKKSTKDAEGKNGRPSLYTEETKEKLCSIIRGLAMQGFTLEKIADTLKIGTATLKGWRDKYSDVEEALQGADVVNGLLLGTAHKMALGYHFEEEYISKGGVVSLKKFAKPDSRMMALLLYNKLGITDKVPAEDTQKTFNLVITKEEAEKL